MGIPFFRLEMFYSIILLKIFTGPFGWYLVFLLCSGLPRYFKLGSFFIFHFLWLLCSGFPWNLLHLRLSLPFLIFCWWCLHLWFLISFLGFPSPELSPFGCLFICVCDCDFVFVFLSLLPVFRSWVDLFNSITCLVVLSCNSLRDFCVFSLRTSTCLAVFSCNS